VVAYTRLAKKFKSYEARRQLLGEYDVFLVDERVARLLPAALGKVFYSSPTKRPIPVSLTGKENWGKKTKKTAYDRLKPKSKTAPTVVGKPEDVGSDIEKALSTLAIHLSPSPTLSVKVAYAAWPAEWIQENVDAVVDRVILKYVPNKWNGLKSLFLKGPDTAALPIWMADELWQDENMVLDENEEETGINMKKRSKEERQRRKDIQAEKQQKRLADAESTVAEGKKRKRAPVEDEAAPPKKSKKATEPVETEVAVESKKSKGKQKRKADDDSEEDEEFAKAQELHKKLRAKKAKVVAPKEMVLEAEAAPKPVAEAQKLPAREKTTPAVKETVKPAAKEAVKPAAKEAPRKEKPAKDVLKKHKKGNMAKGQLKGQEPAKEKSRK
jgi:ribosome biogenesis protein UTP30